MSGWRFASQTVGPCRGGKKSSGGGKKKDVPIVREKGGGGVVLPQDQNLTNPPPQQKEKRKKTHLQNKGGDNKISRAEKKRGRPLQVVKIGSVPKRKKDRSCAGGKALCPPSKKKMRGISPALGDASPSDKPEEGEKKGSDPQDQKKPLSVNPRRKEKKTL